MVRLYRRDGRAAARLRSMYPNGRADRRAKAYARVWAAVFGTGFIGRRWIALEVVGRRTGTLRRVPLGMARHEGRWYLVSMLGECAWVRNVRAADGRAAIKRGRRRPVRLVEVRVESRAPIIKAYLQKVPGARPHIRADPDAPVEDIAASAPRVPVFAITRPQAARLAESPATGRTVR
ncbi:nitroreductase/quinone reductase family protein [Microbacterium betulae]|uniref:Nitroreductase/quinone reductase family protein n=1 Tax=Microbacterium betulae TaxID=2981139 RepID=A0AA97FJN0_9MICO|nr:nitroreductase/quinone reductase family protein [Microbacterium sp. AB]WOF23274.1 nitroreductase/quinone reductase family protein [Microbacterium sp. AB]